MNIIVLGASGYLGSKIVHSLIGQGHYVVCTKRSTSKLNRLEDLKEKSDIKLIPATVEAIETVLSYEKFDCVLNMCCNYGRNDVLYGNVIEANIEFPLKVLNTVVENGTEKFITIGTGLPDRLNMYSFSKKMFSEFGNFYVEKHGIDFYNMRLEMFYGSDEPVDRFIPNLMYRMLRGEEVFTTLGTQKRDIIAIDDVVKAIELVMYSDIHGYHEVPVGTGIAPAIAEIVGYIWRETGELSTVHKGAIPMRKNEPDCIADTGFLSRLGNWNPVFWQDGLKQMICEIKEKEKK
ncbi:MAG: NAD(P)-dependent oxidoreductase [Clostridium sp.]|nr:NAD(P)-dependent oxidoreductase [Clostridium sp.]